jgi:hypothetical protein
MEIDALLDETTEIDDRISLADACKLLPKRDGKPLHLYTVRRWTVRGIRGSNGKQVMLKAFRIGRSWYTRRSWLQEFIATLSGEACQSQGVAIDHQDYKGHHRQLIEARRWLDAQGVVRRAK